MESRVHLDINFGPFPLFAIPLNVELIRCDDDIFNEQDEKAGDQKEIDVFLHSLHVDGIDSRIDSKVKDKIIYTTYRAARYWIDTKKDYDEWLKSLTGNTRQGIRRKQRKIKEAAEGTLRMQRYAGPATMAEFHKLARQISETTFHEKKLGQGLPAGESFVQEIDALASEGKCFGSILFLHDEPVSYIYSVMRGRRCEPMYRGYNPEFARLSPGFIHHVMLVEEAFGDPDCDFVDFGLTTFQYKKQLSTDHADCANVLVLSKTVRHRLAILSHRTTVNLTNMINQLIEAVGAKQYLRQWLRGTT